MYNFTLMPKTKDTRLSSDQKGLNVCVKWPIESTWPTGFAAHPKSSLDWEAQNNRKSQKAESRPNGQATKDFFVPYL